MWGSQRSLTSAVLLLLQCKPLDRTKSHQIKHFHMFLFFSSLQKHLTSRTEFIGCRFGGYLEKGLKGQSHPDDVGGSLLFNWKNIYSLLLPEYITSSFTFSSQQMPLLNPVSDPHLIKQIKLRLLLNQMTCWLVLFLLVSLKIKEMALIEEWAFVWAHCLSIPSHSP